MGKIISAISAISAGQKIIYVLREIRIIWDLWDLCDNKQQLNICEQYFVLRGVVDAGGGEGLTALYTGAAAATVLVTADVARPRLRIVDA